MTVRRTWKNYCLQQNQPDPPENNILETQLVKECYLCLLSILLCIPSVFSLVYSPKYASLHYTVTLFFSVFSLVYPQYTITLFFSVYPQSEFSSHIEDKSANGRDTTKSHNSASFYGKKDNSDPTYLPKIPPTHRTAKQSIRLKKPDPQSDNDHLVADSPVSSNSSPLRRSTRLSTHRKEAAIKKPNVK